MSEEYEKCVICHLSIRREEGGLCDDHKYDGQPPRIKRRQLMGDPTRDALLDYSEWLDSEGLILPDDGEDKRSHRDLVSAFLASAAPATPWGMAPR